MKKRKIESHKIAGHKFSNDILVSAVGKRGPGGANTEYEIKTKDGKIVHNIRFQNGNPNEIGINGISNEALLSILIDRQYGFHDGKFCTKETVAALLSLENAMASMQKRTKERLDRGVEGNLIK